MGSDDRHQGVDFTYHSLVGTVSSIMGVQVQSVLPGRVAVAVNDSFPYGNVVIIESNIKILPASLLEKLSIPEGQSLYLLYAHMQEELSVVFDDSVTACQPLGKVGKSGNTEAAHLHLEMRYGPPGVSFTAFSAFVEGVTSEQKANYRRWRTSGEFQHFDPMSFFAAIQSLFGPTGGLTKLLIP